MRAHLIAGSLSLALASAAAADEHTFGDPSLWRAEPGRTYHVRHYRLALRFEPEKGEVFGDEIITLEPLTGGLQRFSLDSADLTTDAVSLLGAAAQPISLAFEQKEEHLWIRLDRGYRAGQVLRVRIAYHGFPRFGLFFENPDANYPDRPREIWSQGETEFNHHWFPCWDYPNDMATSETITTVPEGQVVVSNGRLQSVVHAHGMATWHWVESIPHSSYLVSLAIGPWQRVHDSYRGLPIDYYAQWQASVASVRRAFELTPDMVGFFSRLLIAFPYEKYAQVAVHDFDFGGQENVSATTLKESAVLEDAQAARDYPPTELIAHELAQHWFGDYVQARDWADIWLNEGFATYLPALYTQFHEGNDAYRFQMSRYQQAARDQDRQYIRPIVDRHYSDDGMQMFDATTHEKGAVVLDMLRYVLDGAETAANGSRGSRVFFPALRSYLRRFAAHSVDTSDLIRVLEQATGQDLGWFFDQWVYHAGSPSYRMSAQFDPTTRRETVVVQQTQRGPGVPEVFVMPLELTFHARGGKSRTITVRNDRVEQRYELPLDFEPLWVDFDPHGFIEKTLDFRQPLTALSAAAREDPVMTARLWAVAELGKLYGATSGESVDVLAEVLQKDEFFAARMAAATSLGQLGAGGPLLAAALEHDGDARVRAAAASALARTSDPTTFNALARSLQTDPSYLVRAAAARSLGARSSPAAVAVLLKERSSESELHVRSAIAQALGETAAPQAASVLLADATPGAPVQLRMAALAALAQLRNLEPAQLEERTRLIAAAMDDPYLPLSLSAAQLTVTLRLKAFEARLAQRARSAPTLWLRQTAGTLLKELQAPGTAGHAP